MTELLVAFSIGLASSSHCLMMCGGIASSLSGQVRDYSRWPRLARNLLFHLGRISCYAALGLLIGDVLRVIISQHPSLVFYSRVLTGVMLIVIGFYVMGMGRAVRAIEGQLSFVWQKLQPLVQRFRKVEHYSDAYILGFLWGFLPCGVLYTALIWASSNTSGVSASLLMLFFGLGTIPALFASSVFIQKLLTGRSKKIMGAALIVFGVWSMSAVLMHHFGGHDHGEHGHATEHQEHNVSDEHGHH